MIYKAQIFQTQKWTEGLSLSYMQLKARVSLIFMMFRFSIELLTESGVF